MQKLWIAVMLGVLLSLQGVAMAGEGVRSAAVTSGEFERVKKLTGRWEGTMRHGDEEEPAAVEYQVTSGGSAVVETLFPRHVV